MLKKIAKNYLIILSLYCIIITTIQTFYKLSEFTNKILNILDYLICVIFLVDIIFRLFKTQNKLLFIKESWIDILSSLPVLNLLKFIRCVRLLRIIRILDKFKICWLYTVILIIFSIHPIKLLKQNTISLYK
jgi:voltage-gated potassium channel